MSPTDNDDRKWDPTYLPVIKCVLGKKGIEHRDASEVDKKKVDFFRGKDFVEFMLKHDSVLKRHCQKALDDCLEGRAPADEEDASKIGEALLRGGFIAKAQYQPLIEKKDESGNNKKKKWPDRLVRLSDKKFDPQGFYIIVWEGSQGFRYLMLTLVIGAIIAGCLFPVWPIWARIAAWYVALALCTLYFCLELTRMSVFSMGWIVGCEFWILPNFNDEYCGIIDSFKPLYSFERRKDGMLMLASRFIVLGVVCIAVEELSKTHSLSDVQDFVTGSYQDIIHWGENKALMLEGGGERLQLPTLEELEKEEADEAASSSASSSSKQKEEEVEEAEEVFGKAEPDEHVVEEEL